MAFAPPTAFDYLRRAHENGRLGHAYLIVGGPSAMELAVRLAALTVPAPDALAHQDVHVVEPESKSRRIVIEQIRDLEGSLRLRASQAGGRKVAIIREADRLQIQASNAFLKTLEEPPAQSLLLLVTAQPESLPDTILSRCIRVTLLDVRGGEAGIAEEAALLELLARYAADRAQGQKPSLPAAYGLTREFTGLLASARARVVEEQDAALAAEKKQYAQTTDGSWLADREGYYKGITEARYVAERTRLVERLARWWGDVLRVRTAGGAPEALRGAVEMASGLSAPEILEKLGRIDALRENLDRNIQEALALEVAFLGVFGE